MDCLDRAMECRMPVQCLIFFVDDTQSDQLEPEQGSEAMLSFSIISPGSSSSASTPLTKAFALLPGDYQRLHSHTLHTFQQNDIIILTTENMPNSLSNTENLRIMELHLDGSRRATADPLDVYHPRGCDHLVKRLFLNSTIRITHIKYKHNNPVIPAIDDVILGAMETILGRIIGIPCAFGLGFNGHLLHLAATSGPAVLVQRLLKHGADVDGKTEEGRSSLHSAILGGGEMPLQSLHPRRPPGLNPLSNVRFQASPLPPYIPGLLTRWLKFFLKAERMWNPPIANWQRRSSWPSNTGAWIWSSFF
ncbi:uncharacterized protein [Bemisia tabaci]|uniref:uncharacterized protein n=1 Tax=Bemisia tabaci TaxID=7038 RepID=UPI003B27D47C